MVRRQKTRQAKGRGVGGRGSGIGISASSGWVEPVNPLRIAANLTKPNSLADTTSSGNEQRQSRLPHYFGGDLSEVWLVYGNWWLDIGATGKEQVTGNAVTLGAALEYNGVTVAAPNANGYTLANDETFLAGPLLPAAFGVAKFTDGDQFFSRSSATVTAGQKIPRSGQYASETPASRVSSAAGDTQWKDATGTMTGTVNNTFGPIMVVGRYITPAKAVFSIGDSLEEGQSDSSPYPNSANAGGYVARGAWNASKTSLALMGRAGAAISRHLVSGGADVARRRALYRYATHGLIAYGANDLFNVDGTSFLSTLAAEIVVMRAAGIKHITISAVAPRTVSTDKFITTANQSAQPLWDTTVIATVNAAIAAMVPGTIDAVMDVNADWGDSGGAAKWVVNGVAFYPIPSPTDGSYLGVAGSGTITAATNSTSVIGVGSAFTTEAAVGNFLYQSTTYLGRIASITNDLLLVLEANSLAAASGAAYIIAPSQIGTHPSPALYTLAGTRLTTLLNASPVYQ